MNGEDSGAVCGELWPRSHRCYEPDHAAHRRYGRRESANLVMNVSLSREAGRRIVGELSLPTPVLVITIVPPLSVVPSVNPLLVPAYEIVAAGSTTSFVSTLKAVGEIFAELTLMLPTTVSG